jgi:peroxiredoxin
MPLLLSLFLIFLQPLSCISTAFAQDKNSADALWTRIQNMEKGPQGSPKNRAEAAQEIRNHLTAHQRLLEEFIAGNPGDPRQFQARLRQAAMIASIATLSGDNRELDRAYRLLVDLERARNATREQAADAAFQRVSVLFLQARGREQRMKENVVNAATNFHSRYPGDRRGPRLLVEAASICGDDPRTRRALLETALRDTREEDLKSRIIDTLRQVDLIGRPISFKMPRLTGGNLDLKDLRGQVVLLVFWAASSPQSLYWLQGFLNQASSFPQNTTVVMVSLDEDRDAAQEIVKDLNLPYPVLFDGKGWESSGVRALGINSMPTVWVLDREGRLRSINSDADFAALVRRLQRE